MKVIKVFLLIVVAVLLGKCVYSSHLNYTGYCIEEERFLSEEEMLNAAVQKHLRRTVWTRYKVNGVSDIARAKLNYGSVEEFLSKHPNCCKLTDKEKVGYDSYRQIGFLSKIWGDARTLVVIEHPEQGVDSEGVLQQGIVTETYAIKNCGTALRDFNWWW